MVGSAVGCAVGAVVGATVGVGAPAQAVTIMEAAMNNPLIIKNRLDI
jgi:uncharacterized membrane protein